MRAFTRTRCAPRIPLMFNHVQFNDPSLSLQSPSTFDVISTQLNTPRVIELGMHFDF